MNKYLFLIIFALLHFSCNSDSLNLDKPLDVEPILDDTVGMVEGHVRVKLTDEFATALEKEADSKGVITKTAVKSADDVLASLGIKYMERTFPYAGKFEARTRAEGMHLWYDVYFDSTTPLTRAKVDLSQLDGVVDVEYRPNIVHIKSNLISKVDATKLNNKIAKREATDGEPPIFNDPMLSSQWHYYNDGTKGIAGCDINVFPVWKYYTKGSSDVIVSVVDGGIDITHPDLVDNLWTNADGEHGWNFVARNNIINADDHGTHVAGVIGAVNNNGEGVCGVAGGDALAGVSGVKLMTCQIFTGEISADGSVAIKYGADNGAVISQNSWGYEEYIKMPYSDAAAIDYFIKYAGLDENGNQVGPMAGGIVIFAAGNNNEAHDTLAEYDEVLSVSALGADYKRAYYSNYGSWVDIAAPGGDYYKSSMILSTISKGKYAYMQGTSMACPHVSGIAALILSKFGGQGFTPTMLRKRLLTGVVDVNGYNSFFVDKLGLGLVNAYACLASGSIIAPNTVSDFTGIISANSASLEWSIPADSDDYKASGFTLYYGKTKFDSSLDRDNLPDGIKSIAFNCGSLELGQKVSKTINGLDFNSTYYFAIEANDIANNRSALSEIIFLSTVANNPPIISPADGSSITLNAYENKSLLFNYSDDSNDGLTWSFEQGSNAATAKSLNHGEIIVEFKGVNAPAGSYTAKITVTDSYNLFTEQIINYTILPNHAPVVVGAIEDVIIKGISKSLDIDLSKIFSDEDGEQLLYIAESSSSNIAKIIINENILTLTSTSYGYKDIVVKAKDVLGEEVSVSFKILVRDATQELDLYPNPVVDVLNLRAGEAVNAEVSIIGASGATVLSGNYNSTPFEPARINMKELSAGSYVVVVKYNNKEIKRNIVKL